MRRNRTPRHGDGTAWLVADRQDGDYFCYWYAGADDARLVESSRARTRADALAWGRERTSRVRIRTAEACTYWAGSAPRPGGLTRTWTDPDAAAVEPPSSGSGPLDDPSGERDHRPLATSSPVGHPDPSSDAGEAAASGDAASSGPPT